MSSNDTPFTPADAIRKAVPRRLRFEILRRDDYTCRYCGGQAPDVKLTVDHVIPVVLGGGDDPTNLVTACADCNAGKTSTSPDEHIVADVSADALRWAAAAKRAAEMRRIEANVMADLVHEFYVAWTAVYTDDDLLRGSWESSVQNFINRGLTVADMQDFIYASATSQAQWQHKFRYFCGCCWREVSRREELARQLIEDEAF